MKMNYEAIRLEYNRYVKLMNAGTGDCKVFQDLRAKLKEAKREIGKKRQANSLMSPLIVGNLVQNAAGDVGIIKSTTRVKASVQLLVNKYKPSKMCFGAWSPSKNVVGFTTHLANLTKVEWTPELKALALTSNIDDVRNAAV